MAWQEGEDNRSTGSVIHGNRDWATREKRGLKSATDLVAVRLPLISVAVIDEHSFTHECITKALQDSGNRLDVASFGLCNDCLKSTRMHDLILYHAHACVAHHGYDDDPRLACPTRLLSESAFLAAKNSWLQRQFHTPLGLGDLPFVVGRRRNAREGLPPCQPNLELDDTAPFWLSRNHFIIEKRDGGYQVRDLSSTLGTIVNGEFIGDHFRADNAPLQTGENEVIAGGAHSPFVFSVFIG